MVDNTLNKDSFDSNPSVDDIDDLNSEAWRIRVANSNRAYELSGKALNLSKVIGYQKGIAESLRTFGFCHIRQAKYEKARELLKQAHAMFLQSEDINNQAVTLEYFGIINRSQGDYEASLEELYIALKLSKDHNLRESETLILHHISITYKYLGAMDKALEYALKGLPIAKELKQKMPESYHLNCIGGIYFAMDRYDEALDYYQQSLLLRVEIGDKWGLAGSYDNIGKLYFRQRKYKEALNNCLKSLDITKETGDLKGRGNTLYNTGLIYAGLKNYDDALEYLLKSLEVRKNISDIKGQAEVYCYLGSIYQVSSFSGMDTKISLNYLKKALTVAKELHAKEIAYETHLQLSKLYKDLRDFKLALMHYENYTTIEKEVHNEEIQKRIENLQITHKVSQSKKEAEIFRLKNIELSNLLQELKEQKRQLQHTLIDLKATQSQLIQSEKMASLGELTAGIAHEIQNPLNFVNNFSEVSGEMIDEVNEEIETGYVDEAKKILQDLKGNLEKINHHGRRASGIVKSMLDHSRTTSGEKVETDINALCDEYLRLAYHGMRAKDRSLNSNFEMDLDDSIPKIKVIPQDIGRVLLNLINNAFQAVHEKSLTGLKVLSGMVKVTTRNLGDKIEITVSDNGPGIPEDLKDKIFQPFFTTKPTGQGTGLGLSISYDIITKGHNGKIQVDSIKGGGTEFKIILPL